MVPIKSTSVVTILHGDHVARSRARLQTIIDQARQAQKSITRLDAKRSQTPLLESTLGNPNLFFQSQLIIIEELHSQPITKQKDWAKIIANLDQTNLLEIVLWEKRALTATMLKRFPQASVEEFRVESTLFDWLDSLGNNQDPSKKIELLQKARASEDEYFCFLMLIRQIRLMIQCKSGHQLKAPPFVINKVRSQASHFSTHQLLALYQKLLEIDYRQKTSRQTLSLSQELDLLTINL